MNVEGTHDAGATDLRAATPTPEHAEIPAAQRDHATGNPGEDAGPASVRDGAVRARIRAAIVQAWSTGASGAAPAANAPIPPRAGSLSADFIRGRIREDFVPMAGACYESLLRRRPGVGGRVVMEFEIVADANHGGLVEEARFVANDGGVADAGLDEGEFLTCMRESMMTVAFLRPEGEGRVTVRYPFRLHPDDDDAGR
ncbi:MAG: AgmX/PglI C-terminal domain-containing protein [Polyangiales bacterium]